jgi:uncharacterized protein (TIGR00251 family)
MEIREEAGAITFDVLVTPRASRNKLGPVVGDRLKVAVTAPPVEGGANEAVVATVAKALGVGRRAVTIVSGDGSRRKTLRVAGVTRAALEPLL